MKKLIPIMISGSLLASLLLAGCSTNSEAEGTAVANNQANTAPVDNTDAQQSQGNDNQQNGRPDMSMNFGKIKSISDNTITIYTSEMPSPPAQGTGGTAGADMQNGQAGTPPERPEGDQGSENGTPPEGECRKEVALTAVDKVVDHRAVGCSKPSPSKPQILQLMLIPKL